MAIDFEIANMDFKQGFNIFKTMMNLSDAKHKEIYKKIKYGFEFKFNIYDYINNNLEEHPHRNCVRIRGSFYDLDKYYDEMEKREKVLKDFLLGNSEEIELTFSGGNEE